MYQKQIANVNFERTLMLPQSQQHQQIIIHTHVFIERKCTRCTLMICISAYCCFLNFPRCYGLCLCVHANPTVDFMEESAFSTTMILVLQPRSIMRIGTICLGEGNKDLDPADVDIYTHATYQKMKREKRHGSHQGFSLSGTQRLVTNTPLGIPLSFPLPDSLGPYLCIQGRNGHLSHFERRHNEAIDLACSVSLDECIVSYVLRELTYTYTHTLTMCKCAL
mmetsp:Transcript_14372/g.20063  ORF Transcript_14372/g.20063 Transcript_14372/m.20063 type:complete len:222 (-) Transcript_14372:1189-1854(-)